MKKLVSFVCLCVMCFSFALQAKNTVVTTKNEFTTAWGAQADGDTISVANIKGAVLNVSTVNASTAGGCITLMSQYPDSVATLQIAIEGQNLAEGVTCGFVFENIHLQYRSPDGTSGQIIYYNKKFANISKLIFRNCEISKSVRSLFRSVIPVNTETETWTSCGDVDYFEMTNCLVHNTFFSGSNWPLVYYGHLPVEVNFKNNTFYDMPYNKSLFTMNYADPAQGRNAVINFENNTVCLSGPTGGLISTGTYLGEAAQFNLKNNILLVPNWTNDRNLDTSSYDPPKIVVARYGIVTAQNNLIEGYRNWTAGESLDGDGEGHFLGLDTVPQYTMADLGVSWSDFTNPEEGDYSYLFNSQMATAGSDGGPIGDPRWVLTFADPKYLVVTSNIEEAIVTPNKGVFENGTSVSVSASVVVGYTFSSWNDTLENVISTDNPYTFSITADANLVAYYEAIVPRAVNIDLAGTNTATYSISPAQETYYEGDIITITLNDHAINDFQGWSDGSQAMKRTDTITGDLNLTATFQQYPYILAWDFCQLTANNRTFSDLEANHYSDPSNPGVMNYMGQDTLSPNFQTRNNKFSAAELNFCALRKTPAINFDQPDYLFIKFSTLAQTGIQVTSAMASDNCVYQVQKMQYSLTGADYVDFATDTLPGDSTAFNVWYDFEGTLPVAAENQDSVFVRWIADPTSTRMAVASSDQSFEYLYISKFVVLSNEAAKITAPMTQALSSYTSGGTLFLRSLKEDAVTVYDMLGKKVISTRLKIGLNQINGLARGMYIVRAGTETIKVML